MRKKGNTEETKNDRKLFNKLPNNLLDIYLNTLYNDYIK